MGRLSEHMLESGHTPNPNRRYHTQEVYPYAPAIGKRETSHIAAKAVSKTHNKKQKIVLDTLAQGDFTNSEMFAQIAGLTPDELAQYCKMRALERGLQPRAGELCLKGEVFDTGKRRKNPNGRDEVVWSRKNPSSRDGD